MHVYIMRHGDAALEAPSDAQRPLTHCGCDETRQMAHWFADQHPELEQVLVSPYLRAQQTLQTLKTIVSVPDSVDTLDGLTPSGDAREISDYLHTLASDGVNSVLIIAHLPLVGYLVSALCPEQSPPMFATAGIADIDYDVGQARGKLCWQVSPSKLAKAM